MPVSLGVDIEKVARFRRLLRNARFLSKVFTAQEIRYCRSKRRSAQHFAVRFAAKEAVWKALSAELKRRRVTLGHRDIGVTNDAAGRPEVALPRRLAALARRLTLSLSHTDDYVVAVACLG